MAAPAAAQTGLSVGVDSDDRYRGVSLSAGRPTTSLNWTYDDASGLYIGASGIAAETAKHRLGALGYDVDIGYAARLGPKTGCDVGITTLHVDDEIVAPFAIDYPSVYAGYHYKNIATYLYYSPDYFRHLKTFYLDATATFPLDRHWRLDGHLGALIPLDSEAQAGATRDQFDLRVGSALDLGAAEVRLDASATSPASGSRPGSHAAPALTISVAHFF